MKVRTRLRAGNFLSGAIREAQQVSQMASDFYRNQNEQVKGIASGLSAKASGMWRALVG